MDAGYGMAGGGGGVGVGEKKAVFIEHRSGVGSAYFTLVASCLMTRLDVLPSAYLLESFHSGLKKRRVERTLCVCVCNAILHMADGPTRKLGTRKWLFNPVVECLQYLYRKDS